MSSTSRHFLHFKERVRDTSRGSWQETSGTPCFPARSKMSRYGSGRNIEWRSLFSRCLGEFKEAAEDSGFITSKTIQTQNPKKKKKAEYAARWELHVLYSYVAHCQDAGSLSSMPLTTWNQHLNKHVVILFAQLTSVSESSEDDRKPLSSLA